MEISETSRNNVKNERERGGKFCCEKAEKSPNHFCETRQAAIWIPESPCYFCATNGRKLPAFYKPCLPLKKNMKRPMAMIKHLVQKHDMTKGEYDSKTGQVVITKVSSFEAENIRDSYKQIADQQKLDRTKRKEELKIQEMNALALQSEVVKLEKVNTNEDEGRCFKCDICEISFVVENNYNDHIENYHIEIENSHANEAITEGNTISNANEGGDYNMDSDLEEKINSLFEMGEDNRYECNICMMKKESRRNIKRHVKRTHICNCCTLTFLTVEELTEHKFKTHIVDEEKELNVQFEDEKQAPEADAPIPCKICGKEFRKIQSLALHKKNAHKDMAAKILDNNSDNIASPSEEAKVGFTQHLEHVGPHKKRNYKCKLCGNNFAGPIRDAELHVEAIHFPGINKYECDECNKTLNSKKQFYNHKRIVHTKKPEKGKNEEEKDENKQKDEEEKIDCDICGTSFTESEDAMIHIGEVHLEDDLTEEFLKNFPGEIFNCKECGKECGSEYEKKEHILLNHPWDKLKSWLKSSVDGFIIEDDEKEKEKELSEEDKQVETIMKTMTVPTASQNIWKCSYWKCNYSTTTNSKKSDSNKFIMQLHIRQSHIKTRKRKNTDVSLSKDAKRNKSDEDEKDEVEKEREEKGKTASKGKFDCDLCKLPFPSKPELRKHMGRKHRDPLINHLKNKKTDLIFSELTPADGNCWWHAVGDQIKLFGLEEQFPSDGKTLRKFVIEKMKDLEQADQWKETLLEIPGGFEKFLDYYSKDGIWTDNYGFLCAGTSLAIGIPIRIFGTNHNENDDGYIYAGQSAESSNDFIFNIGHYYDKHYQSLKTA